MCLYEGAHLVIPNNEYWRKPLTADINENIPLWRRPLKIDTRPGIMGFSEHNTEVKFFLFFAQIPFIFFLQVNPSDKF